ncbi:MAG TPA: 3-hydroxyacyl-CoA dehydrogenase [Pararobbsia sp.]|nr:3-hydroxyacyl-CoA dehydrogenase [Pararobbsia sp.]
MTRIAVVGCGVVGSSWALVFARAGFDVALWDANPEGAAQAVEFVKRSSESLAATGLGDSDNAAAIAARLTPCATLEEALAGADYVQESAPERLAIKRELYEKLDAIAAPDAILASSTSGLPASSFTDHLKHRSRCVVVHPINPPHLIPLVELVPAPWTDDSVVAHAAQLMERVGQSPIRLAREINGFVVNRLQSAMLGEAFRLVEDGLCSAADVDKAVADGLGLRWFFMGPFETIDLNAQQGIAEYCRNLGPMYHGLAKEQADPREWSAPLVTAIEQQRRLVTAAEALPARRAWRDRVLAAVVAAKRRILSGEQTV